jgi:hypothetical protein
MGATTQFWRRFFINRSFSEPSQKFYAAHVGVKITASKLLVFFSFTKSPRPNLHAMCV